MTTPPEPMPQRSFGIPQTAAVQQVQNPLQPSANPPFKPLPAPTGPLPYRLRPTEVIGLREEQVPQDRVIIVHLWWEQAGEVAMRARITSTVNDGPTTLSSAASTIDGIVDAVRAAVNQFLAGEPAGTEGGHG